MVQRADDNELGSFLTSRRARLSPTDVGFPGGGRRRTPGLRREEVAILSGVSVSWYTWLEQGRQINASIEVLDSIANVLQMSAAERDHMVELAGHALRRTGSPTGSDVPEWATRLIESVDPAPAYILGPTWEYLAWNDAQLRLFPALADLEAHDRNLVWAMFALTSTRELIVDWESDARSVLSQFRADITPWRNEPSVVDLIARLRSVSTEFDSWWDNHDVSTFQTRLRRFNHPTEGLVTYEHQQLLGAGRTDLRFVVQLPVDRSPK